MASSRSIAVAAIMVVALSGACVSTPVSAPSDGQILLSANPSTVVLDEFAVPAITAGTTVVNMLLYPSCHVPLLSFGVPLGAFGFL